MPAKAALASIAPSPFKGETFPQYVLYRSTRGSKTPCIAAATDTQVSTRIPQTATTCLTVSTLKQDPPPLRARRPSPSQRPSLSEQLQTISQGAQAITAQLAATYKLPNAPTLTASSSTTQTSSLSRDKAFQATTISLNVGKLASRFPCPVTFSSDRCTYLFQHPFEAKEVLMIMYYRDMLHASVNTTGKSFRFRLSRVLEQFGDDYNPINAQHWLRIVLATPSEAHKVKQFLSRLDVIASKRSSSCTAHQ
ncbi:hypothetical protein GN244_ATG19855 [Phytophthora infestans]|uniref:Uncharacterized protein n=1 Tax=Phytophthora infestans TaxID=4787 RepID=A0A833SG44_PHYIN|nr:hypothetical protein GN244_ATG19855 [Phytophthora infestans]KAF4128998.1 hypothetical protein GN958_ATG21829 [Phytophthora infestans]